jgi:hypothetical protein
MSYKQNNPFSRKSSPLNEGGYCAKSAGKSGCVKKEGDSWRVISNKTGKLWDAHYSSKADAEAGLRAYHGGFSRKSSEPGELKDMPIVDEEKGKGESNYEATHASSPLNEQKWSGNRHDFKRRDVGGVMEKTGDVDHHYKAYEGLSRKSSSPVKHTLTQDGQSYNHTHTEAEGGKGVKITGKKTGMSRQSSSPLKHTKRDKHGRPVKHSYDSHPAGSWEAEIAKHERTTWKKKKKDKAPSRKSSSPLNQDERAGRLKPDYSDYEKQQKRHHEETSESVDKRSGNRFPGVRDGQRSPETFIKSHPNYISKEKWDNATDEQKGISRKSSPLNNTGITGLNYSKELRYNAIDDITQGKGEADYGFSRESSSPLDYGSWAHRDAERAKEKYAEGDYAWGRALGRDEHDADYAKHWHKDEAEHGTSRRSSSPLNKHDEWQKKIDDAKAKDGDDPDFYEKYAHLYKAQEEARLAHKK